MHRTASISIEETAFEGLEPIAATVSRQLRQRAIARLEERDRTRESTEEFIAREWRFSRLQDGWIGRWFHLFWDSRQQLEDYRSINATYRAKLRVMIADLAVLQHLHDKMELPNDLDDLVPEYLRSVPRDPFNGKPIQFQQDSYSYSIRSGGGSSEWPSIVRSISQTEKQLFERDRE